jgi:hypothetical protein
MSADGGVKMLLSQQLVAAQEREHELAASVSKLKRALHTQTSNTGGTDTKVRVGC